ncbi:hypothetical protein CK501_06795 [Halovibrio salipaludis]|uniref:Uncharacterized protein n=1 Tax=Halovibrio salipaludis TaxID=2032626 RepID=A0A2A2F8J2_9GAMM|nr:hypothetical protein [Halovibrio salipaludis]PAU81258.1 hypothetical protein CK501_06795 [Halovibrio salipaludis]
MTTIAIIGVLALLLIIGIVLIVVSQMREKARVERMRRIKALEDGHSLLRRFVDELPNSFLDKALRRLILQRALELAGQLRELNAPGNPKALEEADQAALSALESGQVEGPGEFPMNDQQRVKEVRSLLQMLFRFVERQKKAGRVSAEAARQHLVNILFLVHRVYSELMVFQAQDHEQAKRYRKAIHCYHLAASELEKSKDHPDAAELVTRYRERIKELNRLAEGQDPNAERTEAVMPSSVNREWEEFIHEEEAWKKKADYDS